MAAMGNARHVPRTPALASRRAKEMLAADLRAFAARVFQERVFRGARDAQPVSSSPFSSAPPRPDRSRSLLGEASLAA